MDAFYLLFVPGFTILAFLVGTSIAWFAMMDRVEPEDDDKESQAAH